MVLSRFNEFGLIWNQFPAGCQFRAAGCVTSQHNIGRQAGCCHCRRTTLLSYHHILLVTLHGRPDQYCAASDARIFSTCAPLWVCDRKAQILRGRAKLLPIQIHCRVLLFVKQVYWRRSAGSSHGVRAVVIACLGRSRALRDLFRRVVVGSTHWCVCIRALFRLSLHFPLNIALRLAIIVCSVFRPTSI